MSTVPSSSSSPLCEQIVNEATNMPADAVVIKTGKLARDAKVLCVVPENLRPYLVIVQKENDNHDTLERALKSKLILVKGDDAEQRMKALIDEAAPAMKTARLRHNLASQMFWTSLEATLPAEAPDTGNLTIAGDWQVVERSMTNPLGLLAALLGGAVQFGCDDPDCPVCHGAGAEHPEKAEKP